MYLEDRQLLCMCTTKVVAACIFNKLQPAGLFLALDGTSMHTDPSTSGRKYRKLVNNAVFIRNESLFVVSAAATSAFQLKHTLRLLCSLCPTGYQIQTIEYGKILVMLLYGKYYWRVYKVYNKQCILHFHNKNFPLFCEERLHCRMTVERKQNVNFFLAPTLSVSLVLLLSLWLPEVSV